MHESLRKYWEASQTPNSLVLVWGLFIANYARLSHPSPLGLNKPRAALVLGTLLPLSHLRGA